ncbi:hypothetical protein LTR86_004575 [Recurvomyces mirabilis]|nr:hypothetical protein LTR86_004575 [Recurvomyces mirabilis]
MSYTWGDPTQAKTIVCNQQKLTLGKNCYAMLEDLEQMHYTGCIWVDAICINQDDIKERNAQVGQMGLTFRQAKQTIVYLTERRYEATRAPAVKLPQLSYNPNEGS